LVLTDVELAACETARLVVAEEVTKLPLDGE
jgi:hypothetical protein